MLTWIDLEERFREIEAHRLGLWVDVQWGDAGEFWALKGATNSPAARRFQELAEVAGAKLKAAMSDEKLPQSPNGVPVSPQELWFLALWKLGGAFEREHSAVGKDEAGRSIERIHLGTVPEVVSNSADLCLKLMAELGDPSDCGGGGDVAVAPRKEAEMSKAILSLFTAVAAVVIGGVMGWIGNYHFMSRCIFGEVEIEPGQYVELVRGHKVELVELVGNNPRAGEPGGRTAVLRHHPSGEIYELEEKAGGAVIRIRSIDYRLSVDRTGEDAEGYQVAIISFKSDGADCCWTH